MRCEKFSEVQLSPTFAAVVTDARSAQLDELAAWCLGEDARSAASSELWRLGLPHDDDHIDDLCQDVLLSVLRRIERRGVIVDSHDRPSVIPYARRALSHAAIDLVRLGSSARLEELMDFRSVEGRVNQTVEATDEALEDAMMIDDPDAGYLAELRQRIHVRLTEPAGRAPVWAASASLVALTLADHPRLALRPGTPQPDSRSPGAHAAGRWAGLAYAGRADCFERPETGAVRERRSTALRRVDATLRSAADAARAVAHDGDRDSW